MRTWSSTRRLVSFFASDAFARNEVTASAIGWEAVAVWAKAKGKEIKYTIPKEGTGMFMDCLCIPKDCPHLDLTYKIFLDIGEAKRSRFDAREPGTGTAAEIVDDLKRIGDLGFKRIIVRYRGSGDLKSQIDRFVTEIAPKV